MSDDESLLREYGLDHYSVPAIRAADELAARRTFREKRQASLTDVALDEVVRLMGVTDRVMDEMKRLGEGAVSLRDEWANSPDPLVRECAEQLHTLLIGPR